MSDFTYKKFIARWEEVVDLQPQTLGPFTPLYKTLIRRLKVMPWPYFVLTAVTIVLGLYLLVGSTVTFLVSLLQKSF